jgi:hypothetical protein
VDFDRRGTTRVALAWASGLAAALLAGAAQAPAPDLSRTCVWSMRQPLADAVIAGQPVRLRLDFGAHSPIVLTPAAAERLALASDTRPGTDEEPDRGTVISRVGRKTVRLRWSRESVTVEGVTRPIEVLTPPDYAPGIGDGSIRPSALPCGTVRLEQRAADGRDVETVMRIVEDGTFDGLPVRAMAGKDDIQVEVSPWRRETMGTAATGGVLVTLLGGILTGPVVEVPVVYGVTRPARLLKLDRPWLVAGVKVPALMMRVSDWEGNHAVPPDGDLEADLIQVAKRRNPQRSFRLIHLGQDVLAGCASFEWRRVGNLLAVRCPGGASPELP